MNENFQGRELIEEFKSKSHDIAIYEAKGRDLVKATKLSNGDKHRITVFLAAQCVAINGNKVSAQELEDLPLGLFTRILGKITELMGIDSPLS